MAPSGGSSLTVKLTEPVIFLRNLDSATMRRERRRQRSRAAAEARSMSPQPPLQSAIAQARLGTGANSGPSILQPSGYLLQHGQGASLISFQPTSGRGGAGSRSRSRSRDPRSGSSAITGVDRAARSRSRTGAGTFADSRSPSVSRDASPERSRRQQSRHPLSDIQLAALLHEPLGSSSRESQLESQPTASGTAAEAAGLAGDDGDNFEDTRDRSIDARQAPGIVRGIMTLTLTKPTRIKKIGVRLQGIAKTEWPEGIGARRLDTSERNLLIEKQIVFFDASKSMIPRRSASVMPGGALDEGFDRLVSRDRSASRSRARMADAERPQQFRSSSLAPQSRDHAAQHFSLGMTPATQQVNGHHAAEIGSNGQLPPSADEVPSYAAATAQNSSFDETPAPNSTLNPHAHDCGGTYFDDACHSSPQSVRFVELSSGDLPLRAPTVSPSHASPTTSLHQHIRAANDSPVLGLDIVPTPRSIRSVNSRLSLSSVDAEEARGRSTLPGPSRSQHASRASSPSAEHARYSSHSVESAALDDLPSIHTHRPDAAAQPTTPTIVPMGRAESPVASAMRSNSVVSQNRSQSKSARFSLSSLIGRNKSVSVDRSSPDPERVSSAKGPVYAQKSLNERSSSSTRGRSHGLKALKQALTGNALTEYSDDDGSDNDDDDRGRNANIGWQEMKAGTYNYPIFIPVPASLPPTLHADFGSVRYMLKGFVKRAGALTTNLSALNELHIIAAPNEDDLEAIESIIVERMWETQMSYKIVIHCKSVPVGGQIPVSIRLNPLAKIKVFRITMYLDEKYTYYASEKHVARSFNSAKYEMVKVAHEDARKPLLPIMSDSPTALQDSPLREWLVGVGSAEAAGVTALDPIGQWQLEGSLQVPDCSSTLAFSSSNEQANMSIIHSLKICLRVERGDNDFLDSVGNRKKFDIIVEAPMHILSCRTLQAGQLPTYTSASDQQKNISVTVDGFHPHELSGAERHTQGARVQTLQCATVHTVDTASIQLEQRLLNGTADDTAAAIPPPYTR